MITDRDGRTGTDTFSLMDKVAVVSGAGRGLGRAIALGLASAGAKMFLGSRNVEHLADTMSLITKAGGIAETMSVDISSMDQCETFVAGALKCFGQVDTLVCNAATNVLGAAADMSELDWRRVIDVELSGYYYLSRAAYRPMSSRKSGSIIMVSANSSVVGYADLIGVATAKGGLDMMARNLAVEWGPVGIRVNTINPGWTEHVPPDGADVAAGDGDLEEDIRKTTPLSRRGRVEEFAFPAIFLASDASSYVTGHNLIVDGGYSVK